MDPYSNRDPQPEDIQHEPPRAPAPAGTFRLFQVFGIDVYLHWLWFLLLAFEMQSRRGYDHLAWNLLEFVSIFGIVLMHEFGHALACRSVGGSVRYIVLWLLGGIAYVQPPQRPGAVLWSIAAGPLVNVILIPVLIGAYVVALGLGPDVVSADLLHYLYAVSIINGIILVFNLMPIYPLDGGQILQSLLWFFIGFSKSLRIVSVIGMVAAGLILIAAVITFEIWFIILALFLGSQAWNGYRYARLAASHQM